MNIDKRIVALFGTIAVVSPSIGQAQSIQVLLNEGQSLTASTLQLLAAISILSLAPGILIMVTCFPFLITVFAILRQAIGLQQSPPNMLIVSLALFITYFVMEPVFSETWKNGISPFLNEEIELGEAVSLATRPFQSFMLARVDGETLTALSNTVHGIPTAVENETVPLSLLLPSFLLSEISRAFQVGFLIFLPFLIIDLVVAAILMSMGMMMVPPAIVSLPFKLAFFVVADGWVLLSTSLIQSYS